MAEKKTVRFVVKRGFCVPGTIETFPAEEADNLIAKGWAVAHVAEVAAEPVKPVAGKKLGSR